MKKFAYIGNYADGGSNNSFYRMKGKSYGFKSFPNKKLATFAHAVQSHLSPLSAPKVYSPVCKIRIPNYFVDSNYIHRKHMVLSDWGYLTEIAKPFNCYDSECDGDCANCDWCPHYGNIQDLLCEMADNGIEYHDAHPANLGYVMRKKKKVLVAIDFGAESLGVDDEGDWPEVCWEGAGDRDYCECEDCLKNGRKCLYV